MINRNYFLKTLVLVLVATSSIFAQKTLNIEPVFQRTPVWCWVAVGEMVFNYYGVTNINPRGDYQCGIIALIHPVCNQDCRNCPVPAGSGQRMVNMLTQYPSFASGVSGTETNISVRMLNRALSLSELKSEIDAGRPVIAGISPSGYQATGVSEHVALVIGYNNNNLIVNDPFPFRTIAFSGDPYEIAGGQEIDSGQYLVDYSAFVDKLNWRESIFDIKCAGKSCSNSSNLSANTVSVARDEDSQEMRSCLAQFPDKCIETCKNFYGYSDSECRKSRCLPTPTNVAGWRSVCERKVEENQQIAKAKAEAAKLGGYGNVVARIITEAKTKFSNLKGKIDSVKGDDDISYFFSTLTLPNAQKCYVIESKVSGIRLSCEISKNRSIESALTSHQKALNEIEVSLPKDRFVRIKENSEEEGIKSFTFEAQYGLEPDIRVSTRKFSDEYITSISFEIVDSPIIPSSDKIKSVLSKVIEEAPRGFEFLKGQQIRNFSSWRSKIFLIEGASVNETLARDGKKWLTWNEPQVIGIPTNEQLRLYNEIVGVVKTLVPNWKFYNDGEENPTTKEQWSIFSATSSGDKNIEFEIQSSTNPGSRNDNVIWFKVSLKSPSSTSQSTEKLPTQNPSEISSIQVVPINSEPVGAEIWIDGKYVGSTPSSIKLNVGNHTIKIVRPTYKDWIREITIVSGETKTINAILEKP